MLPKKNNYTVSILPVSGLGHQLLPGTGTSFPAVSGLSLHSCIISASITAYEECCEMDQLQNWVLVAAAGKASPTSPCPQRTNTVLQEVILTSSSSVGRAAQH